MTIRFEDSRFGYSVYYNDTLILECLSEEEVQNLTIAEIMEIAEEEY